MKFDNIYGLHILGPSALNHFEHVHNEIYIIEAFTFLSFL